MDLERRLRVFTDAGLIKEVPTLWQLRQGSLDMFWYVVLPNEKDKDRYEGPLGKPLIRQPILTLYTYGAHLTKLGSGLRNTQDDLIRHLVGVHHYGGQPVYDLQLLQTYDGGIDRLKERFQRLREPITLGDRAQKRMQEMLFGKDLAQEYRDHMDVYVERARIFDYDDNSAEFRRPEFSTLIHFINHCASAYPKTISEEGMTKAIRRTISLTQRRWKEESLSHIWKNIWHKNSVPGSH